MTRGAAWFADDGRTILVANRLDGSISALDPASGTPGQPITGGKGPLDGTVLGDRAYIPDGRARTLIEIDLGSQAIAALDDLDGTLDPFVAECAFGDLWVLDYGGKRILRIRP